MTDLDKAIEEYKETLNSFNEHICSMLNKYIGDAENLANGLAKVRDILKEDRSD